MQPLADHIVSTHRRTHDYKSFLDETFDFRSVLCWSWHPRLQLLLDLCPKPCGQPAFVDPLFAVILLVYC